MLPNWTPLPPHPPPPPPPTHTQVPGNIDLYSIAILLWYPLVPGSQKTLEKGLIHVPVVLYCFTIIWDTQWENLMSYTNNKDADQSAHPRSLISAFVVHNLNSITPTCISAISEISRIKLASVTEQAWCGSYDLGRRHDYDIGDGEKGINVMDGGTLELHGKRKLSWTKLAKTLPKAEHLYSSKVQQRCRVNEKAMISNRYKGIQHPAPNTKQVNSWDFGTFRPP